MPPPRPPDPLLRLGVHHHHRPGGRGLRFPQSLAWSLHMSPLGNFHTAISVLPIGFGLVAFPRDGKIDPRNRLGKLYLITMLIGSITALGFITTKGFTPGQVLTL